MTSQLVQRKNNVLNTSTAGFIYFSRHNVQNVHCTYPDIHARVEWRGYGIHDNYENDGSCKMHSLKCYFNGGLCLIQGARMHDSICAVNVIVSKDMQRLLMWQKSGFFFPPAVSHTLFLVFLSKTLDWTSTVFWAFLCTPNEGSFCAKFGRYFWDTLYWLCFTGSETYVYLAEYDVFQMYQFDIYSMWNAYNEIIISLYVLHLIHILMYKRIMNGTWVFHVERKSNWIN